MSSSLVKVFGSNVKPPGAAWGRTPVQGPGEQPSAQLSSRLWAAEGSPSWNELVSFQVVIPLILHIPLLHRKQVPSVIIQRCEDKQQNLILSLLLYLSHQSLQCFLSLLSFLPYCSVLLEGKHSVDEVAEPVFFFYLSHNKALSNPDFTTVADTAYLLPVSILPIFYAEIQEGT